MTVRSAPFLRGEGMSMYKLYWHPWSSSYGPMAVLEELNVPFDLYEIDYDGGENQSPDYLQRQPLGLIPALEFENGASMFESAAMIQYLCDNHRGIILSPALDDQARPFFLQWLSFLSGTLYPSYNRYYHPERYTISAADADGVKQQSLQTMMTQWQVIEHALVNAGPWLLGEMPSACDIYLQMITTWHEPPTALFDKFPRIEKICKGIVRRPACARAIARHNFSTGLT